MEILNNQYVHYLILIVGTFLFVTLISYLLNKSLDLLIRKKSEQLHIDPTNFIFLKNSSSFVLYAIGLFWIFQKIPYFKALGTAMFAGAGVLAAVIGFASQKAFSNIIGGLFILIFKPFRVGDIIEISNSRKGTVEEITLRHTIIKDYQSQRIVIPNSQISEETIINSSITDDKIRKHIDIGISYESNIDQAMDIIRQEIKNHPLFLDNPTPLIVIPKFEVFKPFKSLNFLTTHSKNDVGSIKLITQHFPNTKVTLSHFESEDYDESTNESEEKWVDYVRTQVKKKLEYQSFNEEISRYVNRESFAITNQFDVFVFTTKPRNFWTRLFDPSTTLSMLTDLETPALVFKLPQSS